jgi:hypothetical protein
MFNLVENPLVFVLVHLLLRLFGVERIGAFLEVA